MQLIVTKAEWDKRWQDGFREGCDSDMIEELKSKLNKVREEYNSSASHSRIAIAVIDHIHDRLYPEAPQHDSSDL